MTQRCTCTCACDAHAPEQRLEQRCELGVSLRRQLARVRIDIGETGHVLDLHRGAGDGVRLCVEVEHDELAERLHSPECANVRLGNDGASIGRNLEW